MKIAYFLTWNLALNDGVAKKILNQVSYWKEKGNEVRIFNQYREYNKLNKLIVYYYNHKLLKGLNDYKPDIVYIRFESLTITLFSILNKYKTIVEINSDDIKELSIDRSVIGELISLYNLLTRRLIYRKLSGLVFVTFELQNTKHMNPFNKPSIVCPNPVIFDRGEKILDPLPKKNNFNVIFLCSSNYPWSGVDRIERIAQFTSQITYHIVGINKSIKASNYGNIIYHGRQDYKDYIKLCRKCDAGIGTMALYRKKMNEACPLKTREYISMGLPVIIAYNDTMFLGLDRLPWWVLVLPNDSSANKQIGKKIEDFLISLSGRRIPIEDILRFSNFSSIEEMRLSFLSSI